MDLKQRLARLDRLTRKPGAAQGMAPDQPVPAPAAPVHDRGDHVPPELGLSRFETAAGPVWWCEHRDPLPALPDPVPDLSGVMSRDADCGPRPAEILFLDTETTGLMGGTGTFVFQLGVSWVDHGDLVTRQYFLPGPAHETAMLRDLAALAAPFRVVVTFNGASFDLPLLRTRALLNRLPDPLGHLVGWDLLVPARRLWGPRLPDCRQQSLERELTGLVRGGGDIDGSRIPQTWFDFLADGQPGLLPNVLTHNHRDMVGMAGILARVCEVGSWLTAGTTGADGLPPAWDDLAGGWALGRIRERRREPEAAAACFARVVGRDWGAVADPGARARFRRDAIRNLKRCRQWDLVAAVIAAGLAWDPTDAELHREAAILYEHRLVDLDRAHRHAVHCGDPHRLARLLRRRSDGGQDGGT